MTKHSSSIILLVPLLAFTLTAWSASNGLAWSKNWYIGGGINGNAENLIDNQGTPEFLERFTVPPFPGDEVELSSYNVGFDVYIGKEINRYWSMEFGYTWVPEINFDVESSETEIADLMINQWNVHFVVLGKLPLGEYLNGFMKLGGTYFGSNQEIIITDDYIPKDELRTYALTYGAGAEIVWKHWGLRGEYTVISPLSHTFDDFYIADLISASLYYKF